MNLVGTLTKIGSSSIFTILFSVFAINLISSKYGPEGVGSFGLYRDYIKLIIFLCSFSCTNAIINAFNSNSIDDKNLYLNNVKKIFIYLTIFFLISSILFSNFLIEIFSFEFTYLVAFTLIGCLGAYNLIQVAILNSLKSISSIALSQVLSSMTSLIILFYLINSTENNIVENISFYLIALYTTWFFVNLLSLRKKYIYMDFYKSLKAKFNKQNINHLTRFATANYVTTIFGILTILAVKIITKNSLGGSDLGYLEAGIMISTIYMAIISTSIGAYVMPVFSNNQANIKMELNKILNLSLILFLLIMIFLIVFAQNIINLIFGENFSASTHIVSSYAIIDILKIYTLIITYTMLAKEKLIEYVFICLSFNMITLAVFIYFINAIGISAIIPSYAFSNIFMFFGCVYVAKRNNYLNNHFSDLCYLIVFSIIFVIYYMVYL